METYDDLKIGERGAWISIFAYICLSSLKLFSGYLFHSEALLADGLNNSTDIIASAAVLIGLRYSRKPADQDHPYGHFRAETVSAMVASFIMFAVGLQVLYQAGVTLFTPAIPTPDWITAWIALFASVAMYAVYRYNLQLARRVNSHAILAVAQDNRSDAMVSVGTFIGITGAQFGMPWLDTATAAVVGFLICKTAWSIFRDASHLLTDGFDADLLESLKHTIATTPGVAEMGEVKARHLGNRIFVDVVILVDHGLTVLEGHRITEEIEKRMMLKHKIRHTHIHIEPVAR